MSVFTWGIIAVAVMGIMLVTGCASRGHALRPTLGIKGDPPPGIKRADAWYIESVPINHNKPFSCSFIEFDERGDYLDFQQHRHAYSKIRQLGEAGERLLVVIYVHGWKNNAHSGDVVKFNHFLKQLASTEFVQNGGFRVHGVYLAWRGNPFHHDLDTTSEPFLATREAFGGQPIVNDHYSRSLLTGCVVWLPEQLSYWSRKNAAEDKVSGVSLIRTIFTCGHTARRYDGPDKPNRVFLMGHSFGALMLEQSFAPASLARLTAEWPWEDKQAILQAKANPLPFDLVMFVNSAAPSIYAKQLHGYMVAHREALADNGVIGSDAPLIISLTSKADWATRVTHKYGNLMAPFYPSLWRNYDGGDFILKMKSNEAPVKIPQYFYYRRTPGHNPLLVNHWIVTATEPVQAAAGQKHLQRNMDTRSDKTDARTFRTSPHKAGGKEHVWQITTVPPDPKWSSYANHQPLCVGTNAVRSGYWIVRCEKQIIAGHNDVWNQQAMETYAALFSETEYLRQRQPVRHQ